MLGAIKTIWGARKVLTPIVENIKPIAGAVKDVVTATAQSKDEIAELFKSFKKKLDTDGDGKADFTPKEGAEFLGEVIVVVVKRL